MPPLRFVLIDAAGLAAQRQSLADLASHLRTAVDPGLAEMLGPILGQTEALLAAKPRDPAWGCFLVADDAAGRLVGTCGFKDGPDADGVVEIAYGTFPPFEGRGYATRMAADLLAMASRHPGVRVVAHTLPERNASGRVLEKAGFRFVGDVIDPEDGPVWRWEAARVE